ncbi:unnamed protein product, partial [Symbiodinium sp. CCMP2456]
GLRVGGGPGLEGLLEGIVSQLMPLITEMIQKAIAEALGSAIGPSALSPAGDQEDQTSEPRSKRHKGGGRDPKRKAPDTMEQEAAPAEGEWRTVQRRKEDAEPFELRGQDWDVPIVPHDAIGRKLDELPENKALEGVVLATKAQLDTVRTILRGTTKPHRIMCVEVKKDGKERIPGRSGNQLRFKQAEITTHFSQGSSAPRYAGTKAAVVSVAPTKTTTVYIRIPAAYCSTERWKEIRNSPAKAVAAWAAEQRVILADSWGWVEESPPKQGKQLFGKARLAEKEMSSLLCVSGRGGIFVDCIRDAIPAQVQWLARTDNEPATAYLERGLRMSAQLGLASQGGRLGARSTRDPNAAIPRVWVLPHVPPDWGPPEVTQVLEQSFDSVTLIHHRRTGREQLYRFRGTHKFGDRDIVPLQVQVSEEGTASEMTMWATIAPVKTPSNKQTWLRNQAVPLIAPKEPGLKSAQVKAPQASSVAANGEPQQPAQVRAVSHRQLPAGVKIEEAPKDGSCLYHSMAKGLHWLTGKSYCHRDLRAKANQHIEKHLEQYLPEFDGHGPNHEKLRDAHPGDDAAALRAYLKLAAGESAYASNLEIKENRRAKTIALWLTPKHVDLLLPTASDASYPAELFDPSPGQLIDLRAGGRAQDGAASVCSRASQASRASGQWTRASGAASSRQSTSQAKVQPTGQVAQVGNGARVVASSAGASSIRTGTVWSARSSKRRKVDSVQGHEPRQRDLVARTGQATQPNQDCSYPPSSGAADGAGEDELHIPAPPTPDADAVRPARCKPAYFRTEQGAAIARQGVFQCEFCPFRVQGTDPRKIGKTRYWHLTHYHEGRGIWQKPQKLQLTGRGKKADFLWKCPLCRLGLRRAEAEGQPPNKISRAKTAHRLQAHPEVNEAAWKVLTHRQGMGSVGKAKIRAARFNIRTSLIKVKELPAHIVSFVLPVPRKTKQDDLQVPRAADQIGFRSCWKCRRCGTIARATTTLKNHTGAQCPRTNPGVVQNRLRALRKLERKVAGANNTGFSKTQLQEIFQTARRTIEVSDLQCGQDAAVAAFQEADINRATAPGFAAAWRRHGFQTALGSCGHKGLRRVALVSSLPMQPVDLSMDVHCDRAAAGLVSMPLGARRASVLVVSFYGFSWDLGRTNEAFDALMKAIAVFGGPFIILGDYNCTQAEGLVAATLSAFAVRAADESCLLEPPCTNPANTRRIDYALTHPDLVAIGGHTFRQPEISDHGIVRVATTSFPRTELDLLLSASRLDSAWALLSDWAEAYLGISDAECRWSLPWQPQPKELPCGAPTCNGHEPRPLRALRQLARRLQQFLQEPWNSALHGRLCRSLGHVRAQVPDLPFIDPADPAQALPQVNAIIEEHRVAHRTSCLDKWQQKMQEAPERAIKWIKRRADLDLALQQPPVLAEASNGTIHPADRLQEQGELWLRRWQTPATTADIPAFRRLLRNLPSHAQVELDLVPTTQELKSAMGKMRSKSPGADGWKAHMLLGLPATWWSGFQSLWAAVITEGQVPSLWRRSLIVLLSKRNHATRPVALLPMAWRAGARAVARRLKGWVVSWNGARACGAAPGRSVANVHARILQAWHLGTHSFIQQDLSSFFDSLSMPAITETLSHLGAPAALARLIANFYAQQFRLFTIDGHTSPCWRAANVGLLQGCPLSPLLSLCVGHLWTQHVSHTVESGIFIDDRVLWFPEGSSATNEAAQQALQRSDDFDAAGLDLLP